LGITAPVRAADAILAQGSRLEGGNSRTRLVVDLSGAAQPTVFTLANPYRVIIDLPDVVFPSDMKAEEGGKGLISAYRFGLIAPGRSRIVIDSARPVAVEKLDVAASSGGEGSQLLLDLVPVSRSTFLKEAAKLGTAPQQAPAVEAQPPADQADRRPIITIDPGHGGIDSGARARSGEEEKDVVLKFGLALRDKLMATGRYRVVMTRDDDSFVALQQRVRMAREKQANLFISIHADSISARSRGVRGATIYTLSERASDRQAEKLAEKENRADLIAGVDLTEEPDEVAGILIELAHRETKVFSSRFAQTLMSSVKDAMQMNTNPVRSAGFMVLKAPDVPSVLLELGYMSSKDDIKLLTSQAWRDSASQSMVSAIDAFFGTGSVAAPAPDAN
jgi:N-acetylmuramoyl-L-alanine amidase